MSKSRLSDRSRSCSACKLYAGSLDEVIPLVKQAIRLSPRDPHVGTWYYLIGSVHLLQSRTDEAIVWLEKARSAMPTDPFHHNRLAKPPMPSEAKPNAPPPNSPNLGGLTAENFFRASPT